MILFYLICYDIPDDKRRKKIAALLEGYGERVQYSVFECNLKTKQYRVLQIRLRKIFNPEKDNLRFYPISTHTFAQIEVWGVAVEVTSPADSIII